MKNEKKRNRSSDVRLHEIYRRDTVVFQVQRSPERGSRFFRARERREGARVKRALLIGIDEKENHGAKRATTTGAMHLTVLSKDLRALVARDNI